MDEKKITIEIRQEVAVMLVFMVAGVIFVYAAFTIPPKSYELWPALNAGGIAAGIYLVALLSYVLRKPLSTKHRRLAGVIGMIALGAVAFTWVRSEEQTCWQANKLIQIRAVIGRGIYAATIPHYLLPTLEEFHRQKAMTKESLGTIFRRLHNNAEVGTNTYLPAYPNDKNQVFVKTLEPDTIILVGQETYAKGRNLQFKNFDGKIGMVQEEYTLTKKGLTHESEN
jgi:hypothetical protein